MPFFQFQLNPNQIPNSDFLSSFNIGLTPVVAWFVVGIVGVKFFIISAVMFYHWRRFGFEKQVMARAALIYFSVSVVLFGGSVISLAVYLNSM